MAVVVVGGHSRNIGKTSVVAGIISALPERRWTALKITQDGHGLWSADGDEAADGSIYEHSLAVTEEDELASGTDSSRYLAAGAVRALWMRTRAGDLAEAMPRIQHEIRRAENFIIESNSILAYLKPDLYLSVLDPSVADFKDSARRYLDRASAILTPEGASTDEGLSEALRGLITDAPILPMRPPIYVTDEIVSFLRDQLG